MENITYNSIRRAVRHITTTDFCASTDDIENLFALNRASKYLTLTGKECSQEDMQIHYKYYQSKQQ